MVHLDAVLQLIVTRQSIDLESVEQCPKGILRVDRQEGYITLIVLVLILLFVFVHFVGFESRSAPLSGTAVIDFAIGPPARFDAPSFCSSVRRSHSSTHCNAPADSGHTVGQQWPRRLFIVWLEEAPASVDNLESLRILAHGELARRKASCRAIIMVKHLQIGELEFADS